MSGLYMPAGDPAALEAAAGSLRSYGSQIATLSESTRSTTGQIATNADWTGSSADAYSAFSGSFTTGIAGMQAPLQSVPSAVSGYATALRDAQTKVTDYETYAQQVNSFVGPVSTQEQAQITAQAQQLMTTAQDALDGLEQAAKDAGNALRSIGKELEDVFAVEGPFHTWLETLTRPWDSVGADAILEGVLQHGEELEKAFKKSEKAAEEGQKAAKAAQAALDAALDSDFQDIVGGVMKDMVKGNADLNDLKNAVENWKVLASWATQAASKGGALEAPATPEESTLLKLLPYLKNLGRAADLAGVIGGTYTLISPPEYDHGGMRVTARVAGGALALGSAAGLAASFGVFDASATLALVVPGVGEVVAAAAGLYLVGDFVYHNTHAIAHTFDSARHTAAHVADDLVSWL
jgi:uncharacterized protein YukE